MEAIDLKDLVAAQEREIMIVKKERDDARELAKDSEPLLPGWGWAVIGASAGALAMELKK